MNATKVKDKLEEFLSVFNPDVENMAKVKNEDENLLSNVKQQLLNEIMEKFESVFQEVSTTLAQSKSASEQKMNLWDKLHHRKNQLEEMLNKVSNVANMRDIEDWAIIKEDDELISQEFKYFEEAEKSGNDWKEHKDYLCLEPKVIDVIEHSNCLNFYIKNQMNQKLKEIL